MKALGLIFVCVAMVVLAGCESRVDRAAQAAEYCADRGGVQSMAGSGGWAKYFTCADGSNGSVTSYPSESTFYPAATEGTTP